MNDIATTNEQNTNVVSTNVTPNTLLQIAVNNGADLERLEKIMEMQVQWEAHEARKAYTEAMTLFRSGVGSITKNKKGHNSKYADLAHTLDAIKDALSVNGLSHSWINNQHENGQITVTCCVTHRLGHKECTSISANPDTSGSKNDVQAIGSTITYLQRYTLYSILGLASTDQDNDGAGGEKVKKTLTPANIDAWARAIVAYERDGNLKEVLKHVNISAADQKKLIKQAKETIKPVPDVS